MKILTIFTVFDPLLQSAISKSRKHPTKFRDANTAQEKFYWPLPPLLGHKKKNCQKMGKLFEKTFIKFRQSRNYHYKKTRGSPA